MKTSKISNLIMSCALLLLASGVVCAAVNKKTDVEKKLTKTNLPAAVLAAFEKSYPKAVIKGVGSEKEDSATYFEVESIDGNTKRDLLYAADGTIHEVEEGVTIKDLPEAARQILGKDYPKEKINKAEKVTRGAEVTYEVSLGKGKEKIEIAFDAAGKTIKKENKGKEGSEKEGEDKD
jgi:hypothetical protein